MVSSETNFTHLGSNCLGTAANGGGYYSWRFDVMLPSRGFTHHNTLRVSRENQKNIYEETNTIGCFRNKRKGILDHLHSCQLIFYTIKYKEID